MDLGFLAGLVLQLPQCPLLGLGDLVTLARLADRLDLCHLEHLVFQLDLVHLSDPALLGFLEFPVDLVLPWLRFLLVSLGDLVHLEFLGDLLDLEFLEDLGFPVDLDLLSPQLLLVSLEALALLARLLDLGSLALLVFLAGLVNP